MGNENSSKSIIKDFLNRCHPLVVFGIALALLFVLDLWVRAYIQHPDLIVRNEGHAPIAVPYLLKQMSITEDVAVAWAGASVSQGINTTTPRTTAPAIVEKLLRTMKVPLRTYNLSHAGNIIADNYCLTHASINHGADLVVYEIVFGLFGGRGRGMQNAKHEFIWYMRDLPDFEHVRNTLLLVNGKDWINSYPRLLVKDHWALFNYRSVLLHHFLGRHEPVGMQVGDKLMLAENMSIVRHGHDVFGDPPEGKNTDYYWKYKQDQTMIKVATEFFKKKMSKLQLTVKERRMRMIARACVEGKNKKVPVLFYLAPINAELLDDRQAMNWQIYDRYRAVVKEALRAQGCDLYDLTDKVPSKYFTDSQHMNMKGHQKMANLLVRPIAKMLKESGKLK